MSLTNGKTRPRVLIAADHLATRTGVRLALRGADCSEADNAEDAIAVAVRDTPDVCVIDFDPPGRGIRVAARITSKVPGTSIVLMTRRLAEEELVAAVHAGVLGYVHGDVDPVRLSHIVSSVMRGEAAVPRALVARLIVELRGRESSRRRLELRGMPSAELSAREWEVVDLLGQGASTQAIAELLGISVVTVRRHASSGRKKLGVRTRAELLELLVGP
jgi:DNA-binding NarL/FixJ family response regulator